MLKIYVKSLIACNDSTLKLTTLKRKRGKPKPKTNAKLTFLSKFQSDVMIEVEKMEKISEEWTGLSPQEAAENTPESAVSTVK